MRNSGTGVSPVKEISSIIEIVLRSRTPDLSCEGPGCLTDETRTQQNADAAIRQSPERQRGVETTLTFPIPSPPIHPFASQATTSQSSIFQLTRRDQSAYLSVSGSERFTAHADNFAGVAQW